MKDLSAGKVFLGLIAIVVVVSIAQYHYAPPVDWMCIGVFC